MIYKVNGQTGKLDYVGHEPTQGKNPRSFGIDPTGTFLIARQPELKQPRSLPGESEDGRPPGHRHRRRGADAGVRQDRRPVEAVFALERLVLQSKGF